MQPLVILQLLTLLLLANGTPVIVKRVWGSRFSYPLDGGVRFIDGQHLFGPSKTIRGVLSSVLVTLAGAPLIGLDWKIGLVVGCAAMAGDLFSSFVKRRLRRPPSSRATGLDQIPESLLPLLGCRSMLDLTVVDIAVGVILFFIGEIVLSRLLFKLGVRNRPY
ncbi:MAG: CDP-archaeol synthase [Hyphomicrobiales bacterium]|nr:CDP-archaeol synthase [Hyphomicrobiales bacterium]